MTRRRGITPVVSDEVRTMPERPPVLDYQRVPPQDEEPASRTGEWIVLVAFILIDVIIFLATS